MHFLYPAFLFSLFLLSIPVLVHLFNFRRYQKVYFSNVQFLREIKEQQSSRRNIRERLILAARMLALAFLILGFAKPYVPRQNGSTSGKQQVVSIFVDNSYSMQTLNNEGALLDEAKRRAREIASAYGINDTFQLLTQDFEGRHQRLLSRDEFLDAVNGVRISAQSRNLQQIINRQQTLLNMRRDGIRSIYIISDFQQNMAGSRRITADIGIRINLVQLNASTLPNVAVDSVELLSAIHRPGESEKLVVRLHNYAGERAERIPLKLIVNGAQKALGSYTVNPHSMQYDTLVFSGLSAGWQRAVISLQDNPITFDNQFYFSFYVRQQMTVLLIDGGTPDPYLKAVFAIDPFFAARRVSDGNIDYAGLSTYPLIVLSDAGEVSTGLSQQLQTYVNKGGTLVVFPPQDGDLASYKSLLQALHTAFPISLTTGDTKVAAINLQNPVFINIFEDFPQNPDLPVIKKYYKLSQPAVGPAEGLMMLPGGIPFISAYRSGRGIVYISAVPLSEDFSNLPRHALFVPIMFRIALLSGHDQPPFYILGRDAGMEIPAVQTGEGQLLKLTGNGKSIIPDARQQEGSTLIYIADELKETGLYDLKKADSMLAVLAFNDNRSESDLSYLTAADLARLMPPQAVLIHAGKGPLNKAVMEANFGIQLWKLCIILALIFLAAEIMLIRFFKAGQQHFS